MSNTDDSSVPFDRDEESPGARGEGAASDAGRQRPDPDFEGVDITEREGPDLEAGDDLDTGDGGPQRRR